MLIQVINCILTKYEDNKTALISILQEIQQEFGYLPADVLKFVSEKLNLKLIDVYSVATFYKSLRLSPQGKHSITLCTGTACHVRGTQSILDEVQFQLGIAPGGTTQDKKFTFNTVNCLGACAIGPVLVVDGSYHGQMTPVKAREILKNINGKPIKKAKVR